jgi:hypothetical protein
MIIADIALATPHVEKHLTSTETVGDIVIGMADGLTIPFALAAALAAAVASTKVIVTTDLADIVAERARENCEIDKLPDKNSEIAGKSVRSRHGSISGSLFRRDPPRLVAGGARTHTPGACTRG